MGSSPSRNVTPAAIADDDEACNEKQTTPPHRKSTSSPSKLVNQTETSPIVKTERKKYKRLLGEAKEQAAASEEKAKTLEKELTDTECRNLDLQDQVQHLEQRMDMLQKDNVISAAEGCEETVHAQEQYIEKLKREATTAEENLNKMKRIHKKKMKLLKCQVMEARQATSLKTFETQGQLTELTEQNQKLRDEMKSQNFRSDGKAKLAMIAEDDHVEDGRTKIILELSSRVSEQDDTIMSLNRQLEEKERELQRLRKTAESNVTLRVPVVDHVLHDSDDGWSPRVDNKTESVKPDTSAETRNDTTAELRAIAEEMKKLKQSKKRKKKRCDVDLMGIDDVLDFRESSGKSRDSGVYGAEAIDSVLCTDPDNSSRSTYTDHQRKYNQMSSCPDSDDECRLDSQASSRASSAGRRTGSASSAGRRTGSGSSAGRGGRAFTSAGSATDENKRTTLDLSSIRQISAPKNKRTPRSQHIASDVESKRLEGTIVLKKPPPYLRRDESLDDAEMLIRSIDDGGDILQTPGDMMNHTVSVTG